jgi:glycosyltransferase involved in cell wall biosynthesis
MKTALLIAFYFPPFNASSGIQRPLKFAKYLPEHGWRPVVLTASAHAFEEAASDSLSAIPAGTVVERALALDAGRHLAIGGRYLGFTALPDRWVSWFPFAIWRGLRMIRRYRPEVIWATYPIATCHLIGATLARIANLPLVVDYRDAMVVDDFPLDPAQRRVFQRIERRVVALADAAVFTTPSSRELYRMRYPEHPADRLVCIRNGYDEDDFEALPSAPPRRAGSPVRLVHSGLLKMSERDPRPFLAGLAAAIGSGAIDRGAVEVIFRAPGDEDVHRQLVADAGLTGVVHVLPRIAYAEALREMAESDALLIFQDAGCNHLVPAKLYEYIRARRPVLALTDHRGETADLMRESAAGTVLDITSVEEIRDRLPAFLRAVADGTAPPPSADAAQRYSRRRQTAELAELFARTIARRSSAVTLPQGEAV